jgi:hypothetical protein
VNDGAARWGAGFARVVGKKWPNAQQDFRAWAEERNLRIGKVRLFELSSDLAIVHMVAQHGYGPSPKPRIRYGALLECLQQLAEFAKARNAAVHMPRVGSGQAGGNWEIISELIEDRLCKEGIPVTVYDLPETRLREQAQRTLALSH